MSDRVDKAILGGLRRAETHLKEKIYDPDHGLGVRAARLRDRAQELEDEIRQDLQDLFKIRTEIRRRTS